MNFRLLSFLSLFCIPTCLWAQVAPFEKGDRVVHIGDSITHGGSYHSNVYLFYATRFPHKPFVAYNCGISGDTVPGTNERFEEDIAVHRPNKATIMLGMNDAWAWCFDQDGPPQNLINGPVTAFNTYTNAMEKLASSLKDLGSEITFITPSIYDQTAQLDSYNAFGKNDLLGKFSEHIKAIAPRYDASIIDFHGLMNDVNRTLQAKNPSATLVGPDRVHPGSQGHFVMSYAFLKAQELPPTVSKIRIDVESKDGNISKVENCQLGSLRVTNRTTLTFDCTEKALPFPVAPNQRQALEWIPFPRRT